MTFNIKTYNNIAKSGLDILENNGLVVNGKSKQTDGILLRSKILENEDIPQSVQVIARAGAGTNNIPTPIMTARGIPVLNTPGANANAVKDLVICAMLYHSRNIGPAVSALQTLDPHDPKFNDTVENIKKQFVGNEMRTKTLGIIGLGAIGVHVANAAVALGMNVLGYDPYIQLKYSWMLSSEVKQYHSMDELLSDANYISVHVPLNDQTKNLIAKEQLQKVKQGSVLLNFSRAGIVDQKSVIAAVNDETLSGYVCDFPSPQLLKQDQVTCFPHLGASTTEAEENCATMAAQQLSQYLLEGSLENAVNFPTMKLKPLSSPRICIINQNIPKMVSQITDKIGQAHINVTSLNNASLGDMAYTVADLEHELPTHIIEEMKTIPGIIRVRYLSPLQQQEKSHDKVSTTIPTT